MEDCESLGPMLEGEENLIIAAQQIVKALGKKMNYSDDVRKVLADLGSQLSNMSIHDERNDGSTGEGISYIEERLDVVQERIMNWEVDPSMIWDCGQEEALVEYMNAVDEARKLTESLETSSLNEGGGDNSKLLRRAHDVLQTAMARLEEEFRHMLIQNRQPFEPEHMSFRSSEDDGLEEGSIISFEDDPAGDMLHRDSISRNPEEYLIDLVNPDVIPDLKSIANSMFMSNYDQECSQTYICVRKDALDECLFILEMEKLSIEDVLKMEWGSLNSKIKRWIRAMKIFVRVYLASEKWLSDQIFGELGTVNSVMFLEASKASMLQLLNFGEAIAVGPHKPEKLFRILDMYEVLGGLLPDIDTLFSDDAGFSVRTECREVLTRLGDCVRTTFLEFENAIASNTSANPFAGGAIHHLTKYVMNYIKTLIDYSETLNVLLKDRDKGYSISDTIPVSEEENHSGSSSCTMSPMAIHFRSVTDILEANLDEKSNLYRDLSLQHFFLMNNIHYMAQKVKNSELRGVFGDGWIRKLNGKFQQHAMKYERAAWTSILSLLKDDGLRNHGSHSISKTLLKERFRTFYAAFEEVYKNQTAWLIPDRELREDLRISTSQMIIQAYRTFVGRHINDISEKYIKYSADDLQNFLLDLYEGSPRSLQNSHRR